MNLRPKSFTENIVQQIIDNELLLYNLTTNKAFCLNQTSAEIYNLCNGTNEIAVIAEKTNLPKEVVQLAIIDLSKKSLLTERIELPTSRRSLLKNIGLTAVALPVISILIAPTAAHAQSLACGSGTVNPGDAFQAEIIDNTPNQSSPQEAIEACQRNQNRCRSCRIRSSALIVPSFPFTAQCTCD